MIVSSQSNRPLHPPLLMDNKNMVSEHKQLGFTISNDGNWGKHVDRLFKILDKVIHWIRLSTGQLLIQWTASQWIKLVVQKQRQGLARYPLDKILSSGQLP